MDKRKTNRFKPAGSGPFGQLRLRLAAMEVGGHATITPEDVGAEGQKQLLSWVGGVQAPLKKQGVSISMLSLQNGIYITRTA